MQARGLTRAVAEVMIPPVSWGGCAWQVRLMMASFGAWELKSNEVSRNRR